MKQITITVPDNYEIKQDGNTYTIIEKEKVLTYEDIARKLFPEGNTHYYIDSGGCIEKNDNVVYSNVKYPNNCTSKRQAEKLLAINKLINVAKYLNGDWQHDWENRDEDKIFIYIDHLYENIKFGRSGIHQSLEIYFRSAELAQQAIDILGEETIKLALCTDY